MVLGVFERGRNLLENLHFVFKPANRQQSYYIIRIYHRQKSDFSERGLALKGGLRNYHSEPYISKSFFRYYNLIVYY